MLRIFRTLVLVVMAVGVASAQPALSTIQDILYRADGTRFSGTMFIRWNSFQTQDAANIATANVTLQIVNGVLSVKLAPTTTATPGAQYSVTYNSQGRTQFTETWAVPPSSLRLRLRDVRVSQGSAVGPSPIVTPIQIGDVTGLANALSVRPQIGVGFAIGRTAIINQAGQIEGAAGNLGDCIRVDGTSGACGGGNAILPGFADNELPSGSMNGTNTVFTLAHSPSPVESLVLFRNGLLLKQSSDYVLNNATITFLSGAIPLSGDLLLASYRYADANNPFSSLTAPQVICSNVGSTTSQTVLTQLGSCTIPAGLIGTGDRVEIMYHVGHTGTSMGFTGEIQWGSTTVLARAAAASEASLAARVDMGVYAGAQSWESQSWGGSLVFTAGAGTATENSSADLTVSFRASMAGTTSDSVTLRNFTVIRYPAQSNP